MIVKLSECEQFKRRFEMIRKMRMIVGGFLRSVGKFVLPDYWVCFNCGDIKWHEQEVMCWKCGIGEMIYQG